MPWSLSGWSRSGAQGRDQGPEELMRHHEAALVLLREVALIIGGVVKLVLVFDVHGAGVAVLGEHAEEGLPVHCAVARDTPPPPPGVVHGIDAAAAQNVPE